MISGASPGFGDERYVVGVVAGAFEPMEDVEFDGLVGDVSMRHPSVLGGVRRPWLRFFTGSSVSIRDLPRLLRRG